MLLYGGVRNRVPGRTRPGATRLLVGLATLLVAAAAPAARAQEDPALAGENARLQAENERLRAELEALRGEAGEAASEATIAAEEAASAAPEPAPAPAVAPATTKTTEAEYVPMNRVSLSVSRDDSGRIRIVATPWYRTVTHTGLLPLRDFIQFRAVPAREGQPRRVWMNLNRQGVQKTIGPGTVGQIQLGNSVTETPVVDRDMTRRRRIGRQTAVPPRRDEITVFALPAGTLEKLPTSTETTFLAGPVQFRFTDEHTAAAAALAARLAREEMSE